MKWTNLVLALAFSSTCFAGGILPCMVQRRGLTNEQIDGILAKHPDAQLRISAQDWRGMRYQLTRFQNMTNYVEEIGNSNDCARVLLRLHDTAEDLSRTNSTLRASLSHLRASLSQAVKDMEAWRDAATEYEADAKTSQEIRKAVKRAEKNLSKIVKTIEQAKKKASDEAEAALYDILIEILSDPAKED
jgi:hypothetical protein